MTIKRNKITDVLPKEPSALPRPQAAAPRQRAKVKGMTKCIYFPNGSSVERLEEVVAQYPTSSTSKIITQLVDHFLKSAADVNDRMVVLPPSAKVFL